MADHQIEITITTNADGSFTTAIKGSSTVRRGRRIQWDITAPNFRDDTEIYLQFFKSAAGGKHYVQGCMEDGAFNNPNKPGKGGAGKNGRRISGKVRDAAQGNYKYEIRYSDAGGRDHLIEDPELIVEGSPIGPCVKRGNARRAARRKLLAKRAQLARRTKQRRAKARAAKRSRR